MRRAALSTLVLLGALAACRPPRQAWKLMEPPQVRNENFPRGYQVLPTAPLTDWRQVAAFGSEAACDAARQGRIDDAIDRARAALGDDAKFDLDVRRAVNARCITAAR